MDDARRSALKAELEDATAERDRLNVYIETLSDRLGLTPEPSAMAAGAQSEVRDTGSVPTAATPAELVYANEFYSYSKPKAAEIVVRRWSPEPFHRPLRTAALADALRKGGLEIAGTSVLYRSLWNSSRFQAIKGGQWGLKEWYPNGLPGKSKAKPGDESGSIETDRLDDLGATITDFPSQPGEGQLPEEAAAS